MLNMKQFAFKDITKLYNTLKTGWNIYDDMKVGGHYFKLVEYGEDGTQDYALYQNKRTRDIIDIRYDCLTKNNGQVTKEYKLYSVDKYNTGTLYNLA